MKENHKISGFHLVVIILLVIQLLATTGIIVYLCLSQQQNLSVLGETGQQEVKYTLYIGTNDKDTYTQLIPLEEAKETVNQICSKYVDGYTVQEASGGWVDETGTLTQEETLIYSFVDAEEEDLVAIMDEVLVALNQNSIMVERDDMTYTYYSGK